MNNSLVASQVVPEAGQEAERVAVVVPVEVEPLQLAVPVDQQDVTVRVLRGVWVKVEVRPVGGHVPIPAAEAEADIMAEAEVVVEIVLVVAAVAEDLTMLLAPTPQLHQVSEAAMERSRSLLRPDEVTVSASL